MPTDPPADRSVPAALLARQSFDVGMAEQGSTGASALGEAEGITLPR